MPLPYDHGSSYIIPSLYTRLRVRKSHDVALCYYCI
jgi:hypothetical protein